MIGYRWVLLLVLLSLLLTGCVNHQNFTDPPNEYPTSTPIQNNILLIPSSTSTFTAAPSITPISTPEPTTTPIPEPAGCLQPPEDYSIIEVNGHLLNQRTYAMLQHAALIYNGPIDITGTAITQGSYVNTEPLSFGTHDGGGAVDISVIDVTHWEILWDEIPPLILALRIAGFAAWLREFGELSPGSPIHIHAIAIGDKDLSPSAQQQLTGEYGYFRGYNGLPPEYGGPSLDHWGEIVVCKWMVDAGYIDWLNQDE